MVLVSSVSSSITNVESSSFGYRAVEASKSAERKPYHQTHAIIGFLKSISRSYALAWEFQLAVYTIVVSVGVEYLFVSGGGRTSSDPTAYSE